MARAYVSLGSNIDRERNIRAAIAALRAHYGTVQLSPIYESPPEGFDGDSFLNLVAGFDTVETPRQIGTVLGQIEARQGRERLPGGMHPRTLDLDLLLYDQWILREPGLVLPRPDIERYAFVLKPLADLAPEAMHPERGVSFAEMWRQFPGRRTLRPVALDLG